MRFLLALLIVFVFACTAQAYMTEKDYQGEFVRFVKRFDKQYEADELFGRYATFKTNLDIINEHNAVESHTSKQGVHYYSDLTSTEMKAKLNGYRARSGERKVEAGFRAPAALPASVDWVTAGAVTGIKNQGQCGSCWSFSATGSTEGAHFLSTGTLVSLSEQQLMDCSGAYGNEGCDGGEMDAAFQYIIANKGICSEAEYPYTAADGTCKTCTVVATISNYADVIQNNETDLLVHAAVQPVSVAIEADQDVFQNYQSGVISGTSCGTNLDHGVLVVGYGHDETTGLDYWLVKNSWGTSWGLKGYVKIARNANVCGISEDPSYPIA